MEWAQFGLPGIIIVTLAGYVLLIEKRHKDERDEWKKTIDKQFDRQNDSIDKNTNILSALKTLLENRR